ncbi:membrane protein [Hahella sp. CCB-MM4]|uniref:YitT family protein n=1 Tax=Hahella sp. (strain CCB-MM4) TaxID=1926491 RepID=UPI000B9C37E9|nr:YitT family protein [Hahella sp. CCB-MM4]OZG70944.1 membrane protein [Hahella sp. CCB-MM4]
MLSNWRKSLAIIEGCGLVALGLFFLNSAHLLVSGVAGWAIILTHWVPLSFGSWFFLLNCPFFLLSWFALGKQFTFTSLFAIAFVSLLTDGLLSVMSVETIPQWLAGIMAGGLIGAGLTWVMRQGASLGGVNVVAVWAEHRYDLHAGQTLFAADCVVVIFGAWVFTSWELIWSLLGFIVLSWTVGRYHEKSPPQRQQGSGPSKSHNLRPSHKRTLPT